jgi:hypothetical protein
MSIIKIATSEPLPVACSTRKGWGREFINGAGFSFDLQNGKRIDVFLHRQLTKKGRGADAVFAKPAVVAYAVGEGMEWKVVSEPIGERQAGLIAYTARGKAILTGTASIDGSGAWLATMNTLYDNITNCKKHKVAVYVTSDDGDVQVGVKYVCTF